MFIVYSLELVLERTQRSRDSAYVSLQRVTERLDRAPDELEQARQNVSNTLKYVIWRLLTPGLRLVQVISFQEKFPIR